MPDEHSEKKLRLSAVRRAAAGAVLLALAASGAGFCQESPICAQVKLEIPQETTLEREAFDARLALTNMSPTDSITDLKVDIMISGATDYEDAGSVFFVKFASMENVNDVNGSGVIQPDTKGVIRWLLIPAAGAAGNSPLGKLYEVRADIYFKFAGADQYIPTYAEVITVKPQPVLSLEYMLPFSVFADEPLTQDITERVEPFPLALRVSNTGLGFAGNFRLNAGQPAIVDNERGLLIDFNLTGTYVNGVQKENNLLVDFGNILPGRSAQAQWTMTTSLSGRFTAFSADFTHAAELGGQLTSLIQSVTTYTLIKDIIIDLPGRDKLFDLLVNTTTQRSDMTQMLKNGFEPLPDVIFESDRPELTAVYNAPCHAEGGLSGTNSTLTLKVDEQIPPGRWMHCATTAPANGQAALKSVMSRDGALLPAGNFWISRFFDKDKTPWGPQSWTYWLHILDYSGTGGKDSYTMAFDPLAADMPPAAVSDLKAAGGEKTTRLRLCWTAPGEDGTSGSIIGGRYAIEYSTTPSYTGFSTASAQVAFSTYTPAGLYSCRSLTALTAGATHYVRLWSRDAGGAWSGVSNSTAAYTAKVPAAPALATAPDASASVAAGNEIVIRVSASDANLDEGIGEELTFSSATPITDADFEAYAASAAFRWTPGQGQTGIYSATFTVTDKDGLSAYRQVAITVLLQNSPPVLDYIGEKTVEAGRSLAFPITGSDPDGGPLVFSMAPLMQGAAFTAYVSSAAFVWTPAPGQVGVYIATVAVADSFGLSDSAVLRITAMTLPPPPAGLSAVSLGVSSLAWTWEDFSPNEDGFRIYASSTSGAKLGQLTPGATSFTEINLATNTLYSRYVCSFNSYGESERIGFPPVYTLAAPPTGFAVADIGPSFAELSWGDNTNPAPDTLYRIQWWAAGIATSTCLETANLAGRCADIPAGLPVTFNILALNGDGRETPFEGDFPAALITGLTETISPGEQKTISFPLSAGDVKIFVPNGAFAQPVTMTVKLPMAVPATSSGLSATCPSRRAIDISLDKSVQPAKDISITIPYTSCGAQDENKLVIARYDTTHKIWVSLVSTRDISANSVRAKVNHLSLFEVMQVSASGSISLLEVGPNPLRPALNPGQEMVFANLPTGSRLRIYTYSGELVRDLTADSAGMASWNGRNQSGRPAASGVYLVLVQANGKRRIVKVAIER